MNKLKVLCSILLLVCVVKVSTFKSENYLRSRVVQLTGDKKGSCSGVQVHAPSGQDYILSAAHCSILADEQGNVNVRLDETRFIKRRIIEVSIKTDLMLLEGMPNLKGLSIASKFKVGQHLRSFTHGGGMDTYKTEGELVEVAEIDIANNLIRNEADEQACSLPKNRVKEYQTIFGPVKICVIHIKVFLSTTRVIPGSSGGLIANDKGQIIGIVSGGDDFMGAFVTNDQIQEFVEHY